MASRQGGLRSLIVSTLIFPLAKSALTKHILGILFGLHTLLQEFLGSLERANVVSTEGWVQA